MHVRSCPAAEQETLSWHSSLPPRRRPRPEPPGLYRGAGVLLPRTRYACWPAGRPAPPTTAKRASTRTTSKDGRKAGTADLPPGLPTPDSICGSLIIRAADQTKPDADWALAVPWAVRRSLALRLCRLCFGDPRSLSVRVRTDRHRFVFCSSSAGYLSPTIVTSDAARSISARSPLVSSTAAARRFSCSRGTLVVPGIGTIHVAWARSQASASCAGV